MRFLFAFLVGGALCALCQILIDKTTFTPVRILVSLVVFGTFFGALGWFEPLRDFCGAGVSVPLLGFGGNIAGGVRDAIDEQGAIGILTGGFTAASSGCSAALIFGYLAALLSKSRPKRL